MGMSAEVLGALKDLERNRRDVLDMKLRLEWLSAELRAKPHVESEGVLHHVRVVHAQLLRLRLRQTEIAGTLSGAAEPTGLSHEPFEATAQSPLVERVGGHVVESVPPAAASLELPG